LEREIEMLYGDDIGCWQILELRYLER
jgi:hypothetical protein